MPHCLLSSWSSPLPIQYTAPSSSEQYRDKSWLNFILSCSKKDACELLSSRGHYPPVTFSSLFGNRAFPLLFPTSYVLPHPARGEHVLAPAPRTGLQHLLLLHAPHLPTPTPLPLPHADTLKASLTGANIKHFSDSFFFFFSSPKGQFACSYFRSNRWSDP